MIWGKADKSHGPDAPARARTLGENMRVLEIDPVGHFGDLEDTPLAYRLITEWLDGL